MRLKDQLHVLVCGSRPHAWKDPVAVQDAVVGFVRTLPVDTVIVCGGCAGPDTWARNEAKRRGMAVIEVHAPWHLGSRGGPTRNSWMLELLPPGSLVKAFWDGESRGTGMVIQRAAHRVHGFNVSVWRADPEAVSR